MAEQATIAAESREGSGKGPARAIRRTGLVPAVIYGGKQPPKSISVPLKDLERHVRTGRLTSTLMEITLEGGSERVLPREVQLHPVTDRPLHVDFLRLEKGSTIAVMVHVNFTDEEESPGLKRGGVLNTVRRDLELLCPIESIPEEITISLAGLDINDIIHIGSVKLPEGVTPVIADRDFTIASIAAPTVVRDEDAEAAAAEGEEGEGAEGAEGEGAEGAAEGGDSGEDGGKE
ncbi:MAG: 50S ribosomal protein L25/general stress protein Ctc [Rhodospirillales bacterium]|nr:50S ribosomal protein L25/general stress protein Ctc [Rhodospirillales bacterium]